MSDAPTLFWAVNGLLTVLGVVLWSMLKDAKQQIKETAKELSDYREAVAKEYSTKQELRESLNDIKESLRRIEGRLNKET